VVVQVVVAGCCGFSGEKSFQNRKILPAEKNVLKKQEFTGL